MKTVSTVDEMQLIVDDCKKKGKSVGFVPTMGALHEGHIQLVKRAKKESGFIVVSIFVNPTQFNDRGDYEKYPRLVENDLSLLDGEKCDVVFIPSEKEIYPEIDNRKFDFGDLERVMEGKFRPGHFNGVAQIVSRLFDIVRPDKAYFGEKDFQQLAIIKKMTKDLRYFTEIVPCRIVREEDGLAMSSRNRRLSEEERKQASRISSILFEMVKLTEDKSVKETKEFVSRMIEREPALRLEYFEIADKDTLMPVNEWGDRSKLIACIAVFVGEVRLIDNVSF